MTVIILIVSSALCKEVKPCELQTALDFIFLKYTTHPCKYNAIKNMSGGFLALGISMSCWTVLYFVQTIYVCFRKIEEKKRAIIKLLWVHFDEINFKTFDFILLFNASSYGGISRKLYFFTYFGNKITSCARNNIWYTRLISRACLNRKPQEYLRIHADNRSIVFIIKSLFFFYR